MKNRHGGTRTDKRWFSVMWVGLKTSSQDDKTISCRGDEVLRLNLIPLVQSDLTPQGTPGGPGSRSGIGPGEPLRAAAKFTPRSV